MDSESVESLRAKMADKYMREGDLKQPPHLYKGNVLRNAKYENRKKQRRDSNPIVALSKFKRSQEGKNVVRDIGSDPIKVHVWSPHQNRVYNKLIKLEDALLCVDATGKLACSIIHPDGEKSQHIFLYIGVLHCSETQFTVPAMFSETQDTVTICNWLMRWIQSGAESPKEIVC